MGTAGMGLQLLGLFTAAGGAYDKSQSDKLAYETQAAVQRNAAQVDEYRASDALERGQQNAFAHGLKVAQLRGQQRARFGAQGVALDEGSPLSILQDTDYMARIDRSTIEHNAQSEAWVLRQNASNSRINAGLLDYRAASESPLKAAASTLLSGAGSVASSWYKLRRPSYGFDE